MKIVHFCLSCFYIDGYAYQENQLVATHVADGHQVTVIASTESFNTLQQHCFVEASDYIGTDGARVIRLPYRKWGPLALMVKIRAYPGVMSLLEQLAPDVIVFHGLCAWELLTVYRYTRSRPDVVLYADSHEDFNNSARTFLSKWGLHFCFYRPILRYCLPSLRKILCISQETITFVQRMYGVSSERLEFFPLGGYLWNDESYRNTRKAVRIAQGWGEKTRVFLQSGKMDGSKKLGDSLRAFTALPEADIRFVIVGKIMPDALADVKDLIEADNRVIEFGWVSPMRLRDLLCAADVYVQPGTQSATMQMALCCRCSILLADVPSHQVFFDNNGSLIQDYEALAEAMAELARISPETIAEMSRRSAAIASRFLDYKQQARRLLS